MNFQERIAATIKESNKIGYNPTGFIGMITKLDGNVIEVTRRLISSDKPSSGFTTLWEHQRLDLSIEAIVQDFPDLFTDAERKKAADRLKKYAYVLTPS